MAKSVSVFGLGVFGSQAARHLYRGGATVMVADRDEEKVNRIAQHVSQAVCLDAVDQEAVEAAGLFDCEAAVIALRRHFDTTVILTHTLTKHGVKEIVVQVDSELEAEAIRTIGASRVIFAERDIAERVSRDLLLPNLADQIFLGGDAAIVDMECPSNWVGKKLEELDLRRKMNIEVVAFKRKESGGPRAENFEVPPDPDKPIETGLEMLVVGKVKDIQKFRSEVGENKE